MSIKKLLICFLATVFIGIGLCACGNSAESVTELIVGKWENDYIVEDGNSFNYAGDEMTCTIIFNKGGTGYISWTNNTRDNAGNGYRYTLTWEIVEENVVNIEYSNVGSTFTKGFEYNIETNELTDFDDRVYIRVD